MTTFTTAERYLPLTLIGFIPGTWRMRRVLIGLLGLILLCVCAPVRADVSLDDDVSVITLNQGQLSLLRDPSKQLTLDEVRAAQVSGQFKLLPGNLGLGFTSDAVWLHVSVERQTGQPSQWWLEVMLPYLDDIRLFHVSPDGEVDARRGGDRLPQSAKEEYYRGTLFKLDLEPGRHEIYLRLQTTSTMSAIVKLWQPTAFTEHARNSYFAFGLYFSLIFAVMILNLVSWAVSRRVIFLAYSVYLALNIVKWSCIHGFVGAFLFPEQPLLANLTLGISLPLDMAATLVFFALLLELRKYHPRILKLHLFGIVLSIATALATPLGYYQYFTPWLLMTAIAIIAVAPWPCIRLWRTKDIWNRLLVFGIISFDLLIAMNILGTLAILPFNETLGHFGLASNLGHILLLHFGMMLHYRSIERDHAAALEQAAIADRRAAIEAAYREEQSQLLAMITHEIRTPIAVIDAANESLRLLDDAEAELDENRSRRYERIHKASLRMNMVLEIALLEMEKESLALQSKRLDPVHLTYDVIALSAHDATKRVHFSAPESDFTLEADPSLLRIALLNLVDNALKYSPTEKPVTISIEACSTDAGAGLRWVIDDFGPGIPAGMERKIFDKFERGSECGNHPGIGVGLFLVSRIAERHGGHTTAENRPTGGARLSLWLPFTRA